MFDEEYYKNIYQEKSDDELLSLYQREGLTNEAQNALSQILMERGIKLPSEQEKVLAYKNSPETLNKNFDEQPTGNYTLNLIFSHSRIGRLQHLGLFSFYLFIFCIMCFIGYVFSEMNFPIAFVFLIPCMVFALIGTIIIKIRRLNDFGFSGWSLLLALLPAVGAFWVLAIFIMPGSKSENSYGAPPLPAKKSDLCRILSFPIILLLGVLSGL